jgi:hypothetical protein
MHINMAHGLTTQSLVPPDGKLPAYWVETCPITWIVIQDCEEE